MSLHLHQPTSGLCGCSCAFDFKCLSRCSSLLWSLVFWFEPSCAYGVAGVERYRSKSLQAANKSYATPTLAYLRFMGVQLWNRFLPAEAH